MEEALSHDEMEMLLVLDRDGVILNPTAEQFAVAKALHARSLVLIDLAQMKILPTGPGLALSERGT